MMMRGEGKMASKVCQPIATLNLHYDCKH